MLSELLGRQMDQADGAQSESPLAQAIRESAFRVARRVGVNVVWVEALLKLEQPLTDFTHVHSIALDSAVRRALAAIDALPESELVARFGDK